MWVGRAAWAMTPSYQGEIRAGPTCASVNPNLYSRHMLTQNTDCGEKKQQGKTVVQDRHEGQNSMQETPTDPPPKLRHATVPGV